MNKYVKPITNNRADKHFARTRKFSIATTPNFVPPTEVPQNYLSIYNPNLSQKIKNKKKTPIGFYMPVHKLLR